MMRAILFALILALILPLGCRKEKAARDAGGPAAAPPRATVKQPSWREPPITSESYRRAWNEAAGELFDLRWSFDRARPFEIDVAEGDVTMPASRRAGFGQAEAGPISLSAEIVRALDLVGGRLEEKRRRAVAEALSEQQEAHAFFDLKALPAPYAKAAEILSDAAPYAGELFLLQNHPMAPEFERELIRGGDTDSIRFFRRAGGPLSERFGDKLYASAVRSFPDRMTGMAMWPEAMGEGVLEEIEGKGEGARDFLSPFTVVKRGESGELMWMPYSAYPPFATHLRAVAKRLEEAAGVEGIDAALKKELEALAAAVVSADARPFGEALSAWEESSGPIELIVGPFGTGRDPFNSKNFYGFVLGVANPKGEALLAKITPFASELEAAISAASGGAYSPRAKLRPNLRAVDVILASGFFSGDGGGALEFGACAEGGDGCDGKRLVAANHHEAYAPILQAVADAALVSTSAAQVDADSMLLLTALRSIASAVGPRAAPSSGADFAALEEAKKDAAAAHAAAILSARGAIGQGELRRFYAAWLASLFDALRLGQADPEGRAALAEISYLAWHGAIKEQGLKFAIVPERVAPVVESMLSLVVRAISSSSVDAAAEFLASYPARVPDNVAVALSAIEIARVPRGVAVYYSLAASER